LAELDGLEVVHDGKDTLLHFPSVLCTENDHLHTLEVDFDGGGRAHALRESVGGELAGVVDDEVRFAEFQEFRLGGTDQHVVHEQGVIGTSANNPDLDAVLGIPLCLSSEAEGDGNVTPAHYSPPRSRRKRRHCRECSNNRWHVHD